MSIASAISSAQTKIADAYTACNDKGATMPASGSQNLSNLASTISSITTGGGSVTELSYPEWRKDGDTHLWLNIVNSYQLTQQIRIRMIGTIDWGDGTTQSISVTTYTSYTHTYAATGKYRIDLHPTSGTFYLGGASSSYNVMGSRSTSTYYRIAALYQVEVGTSRITTLSNYAFQYCIGLQRVYVPKTITTIGSNLFGYCYALKSVSFEDSSTITSTSCNSLVYSCYILDDFPNFNPPALTSLSSNYYQCWSLTEIILPATLTSIATNSIRYCYGLKYLRCLPTTPPTLADANALGGLPSGCVIEVPSASLAAYQAASIWSTYASQMVGV